MNLDLIILDVVNHILEAEGDEFEERNPLYIFFEKHL